MLTSLFSRPISELDVATAGDANATKCFSLANNFPRFSLKYFCWILNLKT